MKDGYEVPVVSKKRKEKHGMSHMECITLHKPTHSAIAVIDC